MSIPSLTVDAYKAQAKRLRTAMAERGTDMSHSAALELIARQHGARDWNTLAATSDRPNDSAGRPPFAVGDALRGRYLNQPFEGRLLSLSAMPSQGLFKLIIHFDQPVDVVTFDSFSALRQRVSVTVDANGVSPRKTSNGVPHMVLSL